MDSRCTLRIALPTTRVQAIGLKLAPFVNATSTSYGPNDNSSLKNYNLLEALSANKPMLFKFEEQAYVVRKVAGNMPLLGEDQHAMSTETPDEFLIWVQCRDLDTLASGTRDKQWIY